MKTLKVILLLAVFVLTFSAVSSDNNQEATSDADSIELKKSESSKYLALDRKGNKPGNNQA